MRGRASRTAASFLPDLWRFWHSCGCSPFFSPRLLLPVTSSLTGSKEGEQPLEHCTLANGSEHMKRRKSAWPKALRTFLNINGYAFGGGGSRTIFLTCRDSWGITFLKKPRPHKFTHFCGRYPSTP